MLSRSIVSGSFDPLDCSPPGSSVHGIIQARILEWVAFPSPGDLPNPGTEPRSPALQADSLPSEPPGKPSTNKINQKILGLEENTNQKFSPALLLPTTLCLQFFGFPCFHKAFHSQRRRV